MSANSSQKRGSPTSIERVLEEVNNQDSDYDDNDTDKSDLYVVEKILARKKYKGVVKYKVKWEGYPESQCTWEPIEHLTNVKDLIDKFEKIRATGRPKEKEDKENKEDDTKEPEEGKAKTKNTTKPRQRNKKVKKDSVETKTGDDSEIKVKKEKGVKQDKPEDKPEEKPKDNKLIIEEKPREESLPVYGHFKYGDKPKRIASAKQDKDTVLFTIEWEPRKNGDVPMNSQVTGEEIKGYDKDLLLDFYEKRIKFVKSGTRVKQENIPVEEQQHQFQKTSVSKGQIEEEFERSRENEKKSEQKQQGDNSNKGSVRKLFGTAQKEALEPGKRVKVIGSVGKRSEATTRFDEDGFLSDYGTPARFKENIEQEITSYQIERDS